MKYLLLAATLLLITGCTKRIHNWVEYKGVVCECNGSVGIKLNAYDRYECIPCNSKYTKTPKQYVAPITQSKKTGCQTEITKIFTSKAIGKKPITICKGKILTGNMKTRIIKVNK